jgi:acetyl esterase/lipase
MEEGPVKSQRLRSIGGAFALVSSVMITISVVASEKLTAPNKSTGTLHIRDLTIPPSGFWSSEFSSAYSKWLSAAQNAPESPDDAIPARNAPKSEWDAFDAKMNSGLAELLASIRDRYPVEMVDTTIAGVHVGILSPKGGASPENENRILVSLHGGAFVGFRGLTFGQLESTPIAAIGKFKVVTIDYREAPYFHYPAASEDVEAVYRALLKQYKPEAIGIFGCSAGGILTAQTVAWLKHKGLPKPGAIGIFGSGLLTGVTEKQGDSAMWGIGIPPASQLPGARFEVNAAKWYMEGVASDDVRAYPGSSDSMLAAFPSTLFLTGTREYSMSLAVVGHARLLKFGVDSSLYLMEGAPHCAHVVNAGTPEAHDASAYVARWFQQRLAR